MDKDHNKQKPAINSNQDAENRIGERLLGIFAEPPVHLGEEVLDLG